MPPKPAGESLSLRGFDPRRLEHSLAGLNENDMEARPLLPQLGIALAGLLLVSGLAQAQGTASSITNTWREPLLPGALDRIGARFAPSSDVPASCSTRDCRVRLFRMSTGYLVNPVGLDDSDSSAPVRDQPALPASDNDPPGRLQVAAGNDNPFFDFRRPGDLGGVGYFKLHSQVQFLDTGRSACTLGLQAAAPAGLEYDGVQEGPTHVAPNLGWYYDLGDGSGIHGYVGKSVRAAGGWTDTLGRNVEYGLALQRPVPLPDGGVQRNLFMFVEALGRHRPEFGSEKRSALWDILPGLHWRMSDNWWMSSGIMVPVGSQRSDTGQWRVTCSWQF